MLWESLATFSNLLILETQQVSHLRTDAQQVVFTGPLTVLLICSQKASLKAVGFRHEYVQVMSLFLSTTAQLSFFPLNLRFQVHQPKRLARIYTLRRAPPPVCFLLLMFTSQEPLRTINIPVHNYGSFVTQAILIVYQRVHARG